MAERNAKDQLVMELYTAFDSGPEKRDAYAIADAINNLIEDRINKALVERGMDPVF